MPVSGVKLFIQKLNLARRSGILQIYDEGAMTAANLWDAIRTPARPIGASRAIQRFYPAFKYLPETMTASLTDIFPPVSPQITLYDGKHGLNCSQLPIDGNNREKIESAREKVASAMTNFGYRGFSKEIDRGYDPNSSYFIVENKKAEILAAARMSYKTDERNIPLEDGIREDGSNYVLEGEEWLSGEINSFFYQRREGREICNASLALLFATLGRYAWRMGFNHVYCLTDSNNKKTSSLYLHAGFKYSPRFEQTIYFPTFGRAGDDNELKPTKWAVMEMSRAYIVFHALKGINYRSL